MRRLSAAMKGMVMAAMMSGAASALASTYVYVSCEEDGDIATYRMASDGTLEAGPRVPVGVSQSIPMAVSPDKRFLYAVSRAKPYRVHVYAIDRGTGALSELRATPLAETFPYISLDRTGRFLFGASYGAHVISVNAVAPDGAVAPEPLQVIPVGRNAHSIRVDESNRFAFVPTLGSDEIFLFTFDAASGRLASNTPAVYLMKPGTGPRHFITSRDNRFLYVLAELVGTVTTFALDGKTGLLAEVDSVSAVPRDAKLGPGAPRPSNRDTANDIWAADLHLTPDGKFLYASERTSNTLAGFRVDPQSGKLAYLASVPTEPQPRGFAIDPGGKFLVASGEKSETVSVHAIDPTTGALKLIGKYPVGKGGNWVEIIAFE